MKVFFLDLWMDLREKRLAPVAILLLAALIAVPLVLANGGEESTPSVTTTTPTATVASAAVIKSEPAGTETDSKLQTFSSRDPFEPTVRVVATSTSTTSSSGTSTGSTGSTGSTSSGSTSSGSSGSTSGGGTTGSQPSDTSTTPSGTGNTTGETKTTLYTYTVDIRFGEGGSVKAYKNVKRLSLIPEADNPKVVFLGVTTSAKTAVFLVDKNIGVDTAGGKCQPSADECTFLYLRPDADHDEAQLTDADGTVYHLRLLDINRVSVSTANGGSSNGSSGNGNGKTKTNRSPAFTGRTSADEQATVPGDAPPGEPAQRSSFQQFFADSSN